MTARQIEIEDDKLQQYFDGELPEAEAEQLRAEIDASEEVQLRLASLERLHGLMVLAAEESTGDLGSDALFDRVRAGIDQEKSSGAHRSLQAIDGGAEPASGSRPMEGWKISIPVAAGIAAAAAAVFIFIQADTVDPSPVAHTEQPQIEIDEPSMTVIEPEQEVIQGSEVIEVDFGENTGTVFAVQGEAGEPIAVVWINDEELEQVAQ